MSRKEVEMTCTAIDGVLRSLVSLSRLAVLNSLYHNLQSWLATQHHALIACRDPVYHPHLRFLENVKNNPQYLSLHQLTNF